MTSTNGKGDKPRPVDRRRYEANFDRIFRKHKHIPEVPGKATVDLKKPENAAPI